MKRFFQNFLKVFMMVSLLTGCAGAGQGPDDLAINTRHFSMGFSTASRVPLVPDAKKDFEDEALRLISGYGEVAMIETRAYRGAEELTRVKDLVEKALQKHLKVAVGVTLFDEKTFGFLPPEYRFKEEKAKNEFNEYIKALLAFKPDYLGIGLDLYRYKFLQPADYKAYVSLYNSHFKEWKALSPSTKIAPVFNMEVLIDQQDLTAFSEFEEVDLYGLTSFPLHWPLIVSPESMREDYYTQILPFTKDKKLAFFQVAFPSDNGQDEVLGYFYATPDSQKRLLQRFVELTRKLPLEMLIYRFPFDYPSSADSNFSPYFHFTGLLDSKRDPKPAFLLWKKIANMKP